jgi:hypothetical protein
MITRDQVEEYLRTAKPSDIPQVLDVLVDVVSDYMGCAIGLEDDRHAMLLQIQSEEMK